MRSVEAAKLFCQENLPDDGTRRILRGGDLRNLCEFSLHGFQPCLFSCASAWRAKLMVSRANATRPDASKETKRTVKAIPLVRNLFLRWPGWADVDDRHFSLWLNQHGFSIGSALIKRLDEAAGCDFLDQTWIDETFRIRAAARRQELTSAFSIDMLL